MKSVRLLLAGGIVASAVTIAGDLVAGMVTKGYSFVEQSISELGAVGVPTRALVLPVDVARGVLFLGMGAGVWSLAGERRAVRLTGGAIIANAAVGLVFAALPRHLDEPAGSPANTANTIAGALGVACFVAAMGFASVGFRGWFRAVSVGTLLGYLGLTVFGLAVVGQAAEPRPPTIGIQERTMLYAYLVWIVLLAIALWRRDSRAARTREARSTRPILD
jgi:hypothetical membrane protein